MPGTRRASGMMPSRQRQTRGCAMKDFHRIFTEFKEEHKDLYESYESLGRVIHERSGPLEEKTRWLIKVAISGSCGHERALETHIRKAVAAGANFDEIQHALMLMIQTVGFPAFMEAYSVFARIRKGP